MSWPADSAPASLGCKDIPHDKPKVRRPLRKPPHEPRIPKCSVRHENNGSAAFGCEPLLFAALDPIKHLHFEIFFRKTFPGSLLRKLVDHSHVMRCKGNTHASLLFLRT